MSTGGSGEHASLQLSHDLVRIFVGPSLRSLWLRVAAPAVGWRKGRLEQLRLDGEVAEARVLAVERAPITGADEQLWLRYEYRDRTGRRHTGRSDYLSPDEAAGWQAGDIGGVRYSSADPRRSVWVGSLAPRSAGE
jgi:hypothetical protein